MCVCVTGSYVRHDISSGNKLLDLEAQMFARTRMSTTILNYLHMPIFTEIVNVIDLHFQGQIRIENNGKFIPEYIVNGGR